MNDNTIAKVITKIHLKLLAFFLFIFFVFVLGFIALLEGFTISHLKLGDINAKKVYLKWDNRLHINIAYLDLSELKGDDEPLTLKPLKHFPRVIGYAQQWIASLHIQSLRYKHTTLCVNYEKNKLGTIHVQNRNTNLDGNFTLSPKMLLLSLNSPYNSQANIALHLNLNILKQVFTIDSTLKLPNSPAIFGYARGDQKRLYLKISAEEPFSHLGELVDFIGLDPIVRPWVVDYAVFKSATLHACEGSLLYDHPYGLLESLYAHIVATDAHYTFAQGIEPIRSNKVDVYFKKGKLCIVPHEGSFYTLPTEKSDVTIDFTTPHTMLNAHILTSHGMLNDDIIHLLNYYKINIPIRQNKGFTRVNLDLIVNLHDFDTTANGEFIPSNSELQLDDFSFQSSGGKVTLQGAMVKFEGFDAMYHNTARAKVKGYFDAAKEEGDIHIFPYFCAPTGNPKNISLITSTPPHTIYHIDPKQDTITLPKSDWNFFGEQLHLDGITLPLNFKEHSITIPKLGFIMDQKAYGSITGELSLKNWSADLKLDQLNTHNLLLRKIPLEIHVAPQNDSILFSTKQNSFLSLYDQPFVLPPLSLSSNEKSLIFNNIKIKIEDQLNAAVSGEYLWGTQKGTLILTGLSALNPKIATYIDMNRPQNFSMDLSKNIPIFYSTSLGLILSPFDHGWKMQIQDISLLSRNSPLLSQYDLNHGNITLFYAPSDDRITFNGTVEYPYSLMMVHDKPLSTYRFSGLHSKGTTFIRVNDRLNITRNESITIRANNMGINAPELLRWITANQVKGENASTSNETPPIILNGSNLSLYLMGNRKIIADNINATFSNGEVDGRLMHDQGWADITMIEGFFYLEGVNFSDRFMKNLFSFSDFKGGKLSFKLKGKSDLFEGIIRIENATLKEYIVLNNVLSFINTIPALTTFSLPNYNTKGLLVKDTYAHFSYQNRQFFVDNYTLNSPELTIDGSAKVDVLEDTINGSLTLKTDLGSMLGKVPMVGYILLGDDGSISTTVNLKGKLSDPIVETAIAKEIITAPFNILKRTVTYPFLWMIPDEKKK